MATKRKTSNRRYGKSAGKWVASAMRRRKAGTLMSGKGGRGGRVTSRTQAIAIGLSEARAMGGKVPRPRVKAKRKAKESPRDAGTSVPMMFGEFAGF